MKTCKFIKTGKEWYIDLPEFIEQGGNFGDLQMIDGADTMLDIMAGAENSVVLYVARESFSGADVLILTEKCDPYIGGGNYILKKFGGKQINKTIWLCQVTEFVFGDIPEQIFIKRQKS